MVYYYKPEFKNRVMIRIKIISFSLKNWNSLLQNMFFNRIYIIRSWCRISYIINIFIECSLSRKKCVTSDHKFHIGFLLVNCTCIICNSEQLLVLWELHKRPRNSKEEVKNTCRLRSACMEFKSCTGSVCWHQCYFPAFSNRFLAVVQLLEL